MLSDHDILKARDSGRIIIEPFDVRQLGSNSFDVRLGNWFFFPNPSATLLEPWKEESVRFYWGYPIFFGDQVEIPPQTTVLAHTQERIGGRVDIYASMRTRSSAARSGFDVCKAAGLGDVGYVSWWTMEITNLNHVPIVIPIGARVAQMEFIQTGYTKKPYTGKYGQGATFDPMDMLPKPWLDWDADRFRTPVTDVAT